MLDSEEEVSQVLSFESSNAPKLLQLVVPTNNSSQLQTGSLADAIASVLMHYCAVVLPCSLQVDMLDSEEEVSQVLSFVSSNASKLLQLDSPAVLPISGRAALKAKLVCGSAQSGGVLDSWEDELLTSQPGWQKSRWARYLGDLLDLVDLDAMLLWGRGGPAEF
jgi:hypothetical protein